MTKDGTIILLHDDTLERTACFDWALGRSAFQRIVSTPVQDLEFEKVKQIDVGQWQAGAYAPPLEEALRMLPADKEYLVEIKGSDHAIIEPLVDLLQTYLPDPECIKIISFDIEILKEVKARPPQYPVIFNTRLRFTDTPDKMRQELDKVISSEIEGD